MKADFALLDVKDGRDELLKIVGGADGIPATGRRVPVAIYGHITYAWGGDDGISREYEVEVAHIDIGGTLGG